jgi:hypothetical protein
VPKWFKPVAIKNNDTVLIGFSDLHFGKKGTDGVIARLYEMTQQVLARPEKNVKLLFLWDLAETLVEWGMHPGQIEGMDWPFGFDLMMLIVNSMESMLVELYRSGKQIHFICTGGNHDRVGVNHEQDQARTWALVIYEMIKRGLWNLDVDMTVLMDKTSSIDLWDFNVIVNHGDDNWAKLAQTKPEDILWKYWKKNKYNLCLYGDKHNIRINETKDATIIWLPALCWEGEYDKRLSLYSEPGYITITKNQYWTPDITLKRLRK